ncbi:MAG: PIN domain-containing protein [Candidatus Sulfotelmatobacter sp.]
MQVLVDTPIWSLALRRTSSDLNAHEQSLTGMLRELIGDRRAQLIGPVRQELLSGIRHETSFRKLRDQLRAFDEPRIDISDYEEAARIHNQCRSRGIAGSSIDFLICAVAQCRNWEIFTTDRDFTRYASAFPLKLFR